MDEKDNVPSKRGRKAADLRNKRVESLVVVGEPIRKNGNTYWKCGCVGGVRYKGFNCISLNPDIEQRTKEIAYSSISARRQYSCGCLQGKIRSHNPDRAEHYQIAPATGKDFADAGLPVPDEIFLRELADDGVALIDLTDQFSTN